MTETPQLSVVVPLFNEQENVEPLVLAVQDALGDEVDWELILVDDGSGDETPSLVRAWENRDPRVRALVLARNYGQTTAMQAGFDHSRGPIVVSMDGDLQNDPRDIPMLIATLRQGYDLVAGYRVRRQDKMITRRLPSMVANRIIRRLTGVRIRDNGCSLKAYRRGLLRQFHLYSEQHRFIPAVAASMAGASIAEVPVRHHARCRGTSKYGLTRIWKVVADLLTITMIRWFRERPLIMFAWGALAAACAGLFWTVAALVSVATFAPEKAVAIVFPSAALLCFGLAFYLLMLGMIGEVALYGGIGRRLSTEAGRAL